MVTFALPAAVPFVPIINSPEANPSILPTVTPPFKMEKVLPVRSNPAPAEYAPAEGVSQVAKPSASLVSTLPAPGLPPRILICPLTSSLVSGEVPIPILVPLL